MRGASGAKPSVAYAPAVSARLHRATDQAPPRAGVAGSAGARTRRKSDVFSIGMTNPQPALRTVLFAPGNDRRKIEKAFGLRASAVMLDLEDAVAAAREGRGTRRRRATACSA